MDSGVPIIDRPAAVAGRRSDGEILAAIDLGTNSFHLVVARVDADGHVDTLAREKEVVRLGSGAGELREIGADAIERGLDALGRFRRIADSFDASVEAVGTSALREAVNRDEFVRLARERVGIEVDVVSGTEEARLIHLGVLQSVPITDDRMLVVDIGGGSTEMIVGAGTELLVARSLKLGAIRLTDRFFPEGRVRSKAVAECRRYVRSFLAPVLADVRAEAPFRTVGSSGTIVNLARIIAAADGRDPVAVGSGESFTADDLHTAVGELLAHKSAADRAEVAGLDERRRDIIAGGAVLFDEIVDLLAIERVTISDTALREGILIDRVASRDTPGVEHRLADIRRRSVLRMAETFHEDLTHIERVTDLALQLFDGLAARHALGVDDRDLLEAAALLHNVGLFISHAAHHRHSYYVIRNTDQLSGFTDCEIELIAQIARYHRKSAPKPGHAEFQALPTSARYRVRLLAGILRVAIALDRTRSGAVIGVEVLPWCEGDRVAVDVHHRPDADLELEGYTAEARVGLLEEALGTTVAFRFVTDDPAAG